MAIRAMAGALAAMVVAGTAASANACLPFHVNGMAATEHGQVLVANYYYANNGGLLISRDAGASWQLLCSDALAAEGPLWGPPVIARGGRIFVRKRDRLVYDDGTACSWETELMGGFVQALAVDPRDDDILYALVYDRDSTGRYQLMRSTRPGSWETLHTWEADWLASEMRLVGRDDGFRMFVIAWTYHRDESDAGGEFEFKLLVSDDRGASFSATPIQHPDRVGIAAVDANDPDRIALSLHDGDGGRVRIDVSEDGGKTFRPFHTVNELAGMAFDGEGRAYIAGPELWRASTLNEEPVVLSRTRLETCLIHDPETDTLYGCMEALVRIDPETGSWQKLTTAYSSATQLECDGKDVAGACFAQLAGGCAPCAAVGTCPAVCDPYPESDLYCTRGESSDSDPTPRSPSAKEPAESGTLADAGSQSMDASLPVPSQRPMDGGAELVPPKTTTKGGCTLVSASTGNAGASALLAALAAMVARRRHRTRRRPHA